MIKIKWIGRKVIKPLLSQRRRPAYRCGPGMGGRRMIKTAALLITLGYCSLLVYHGSATFYSQSNHIETDPNETNDLSKDDYEIDTNNNTSKLTLDDIFISVKTTQHYENTRLPIVLKTWFELARNQTWFFTDTDNKLHQYQTGGHMINTNCSSQHDRDHLCCKMSVEYDYYLESGKKWFCHFDDDNYVNVPQLVSTLQKYNHLDDWYLGRPSVNEPVELSMNVAFWFATGGAGFCISKSLALKMLPVASGGKFMSICGSIRLPDDVTMGFVIEHLLKTKMTIIPEFHSHYEQMKLLDPETFSRQISFSYFEGNVIKVLGFNSKFDPTRFYSLHCFLFPESEFCLRL